MSFSAFAIQLTNPAHKTKSGGLLLLRRSAPLTRRTVAYFCSGAHSHTAHPVGRPKNLMDYKYRRCLVLDLRINNECVNHAMIVLNRDPLLVARRFLQHRLGPILGRGGGADSERDGRNGEQTFHGHSLAPSPQPLSLSFRRRQTVLVHALVFYGAGVATATLFTPLHAR